MRSAVRAARRARIGLALMAAVRIEGTDLTRDATRHVQPLAWFSRPQQARTAGCQAGPFSV
jgi:hypothetical protein